MFKFLLLIILLISGCDDSKEETVIAIIPETPIIVKPKVFYKLDFENGILDDKIKNAPHLQDIWKNIEIIEETIKGKKNKYLRNRYVPNDNGSERVDFRILEPTDTGIEAATLSYDVYFEDSFEFVMGGKLHGITPENPITEGNENNLESWSVRACWKNDSELVLYVYHQDKLNGQYGEIIPSGVKLNLNTKYNIKIYTKLNKTPGSYDGLVEVYLDNKLIIKKDKLRLRGIVNEKSKIRGIHYSTFHGGTGLEWTPTQVGYAQFDNFILYKGKHIK